MPSISFPRAFSVFSEFLLEAKATTLSPEDIRLLSIIHNDFDEVARVGTASGKRAALIVDKIMASKGADIQFPHINGGKKTALSTLSLRKLETGPFRGFKYRHEFDLSKKYTLVYGPNGTGKSSFCESIEYAVLGSVLEGQKKRIDSSRYIENIAAGKGTKPTLTAVDPKGELVDLSGAPLSFAFIEKNRIDDFARLSATTAGDQTARLAALFGIDEFNTFVSGFNETLKTLNVDSVRQNILKEKQAALHGHQARIAEYPSKKQLIEEEKQKLASQHSMDSFEGLRAFVVGDGAHPGRLSEVQQLLDKQTLARIQPEQVLDVALTGAAINILITKQTATKSALAEKSDALNYKMLYDSLIAVREFNQEKCPACETPLSSATTNPYERAEQGLKNLKALSELQAVAKDVEIDLRKAFAQLVLVVTRLNSVVVKLGVEPILDIEQISRIQGGTEVETNIEAFQKVEDLLGARLTHSLTLVEAWNLGVKQKDAERLILREEREKLLGLQQLITQVEERAKVLELEKKSADEAVEGFAKENAELIREVEEERKNIAENTRYLEAYEKFLARLKDFRDSLPAKLASNLNALTTKYYNAFNMHDEVFDRVGSVKLPNGPGERILITFEGATQAIDALHVLSEGHVRCLGLAILLAKAEEENIPFIVFDDVVNAVDDEHRKAVAETLLTEQGLAGKQLIISCHGDEFLRKIETGFYAPIQADQIQNIDFMRPNEPRCIFVDANPKSRNYVSKATEATKMFRWRDALAESRRALETIASILWKKIHQVNSSGLRVTVRRPGDEPDLSSVCSAIRSYLEKSVKEEAAYIIETLKWIEQPTVWQYFNKATHDIVDRPEFSGKDVETIIAKLHELEAAARDLKFFVQVG